MSGERVKLLLRILHSSCGSRARGARPPTLRQRALPAVLRWSGALSSRLAVLGELFAKQCYAIVAQRVRRTVQIQTLYSRLYGERPLGRRIGSALLGHGKGKPFCFFLGASLFSWDKQRVTDEELDGCAQIFTESKIGIQQMSFVIKSSYCFAGWEKVIDRLHLQLWRKPVANSCLFQYKVCGSFYDIPASAFFTIQVDLEYRKQWDNLVIHLSIMDRDDESGSEIVHWVTHYPYPMYSRDYVYVRRYKVDPEKKVMVLVSRAVDHPLCPPKENYVRVNTYNSHLVIKPHTDFSENGFDYVLTYHDDPQAVFPNFAYSWLASTGVPDFVEKLHTAAKDVYTGSAQNKPARPTEPDQTQYGSISSYC